MSYVLCLSLLKSEHNLTQNWFEMLWAVAADPYTQGSEFF